MAKIFGVLLIVLGVWLGMEIYTKGMDRAFGGVFAGFVEPSEPHEPMGAKAASTVRQSLETSASHGEVDGESADPDDDN